jgi:hypothetical protein
MPLLAVVGTTAQASHVEGNAKYKQGTRLHKTSSGAARNKEFRTLNLNHNAEPVSMPRPRNNGPIRIATEPSSPHKHFPPGNWQPATFDANRAHFVTSTQTGDQ